jgi:hypothetical protein
VMVMRVLSVRLHVFLLLVKREIEVCLLDKLSMFVISGYIGCGFDQESGAARLASGGFALERLVRWRRGTESR